MPKIATYKFLTFFIFAFDAMNERPHLHIAREKGNRQRSAKIWLNNFEFAELGSLTKQEQNIVKRLVEENQIELLHQFEKVKNGQKIETIKLD